MKTENFTACGKLGDFIQMMYALKNICLTRNVKADLYLYHLDGGFELGTDTAYRELYNIISSQSYINSFNMLEGIEVTKTDTWPYRELKVYEPKLVEEGYTHLEDLFRSPLLYKSCWAEILSDTFGFENKKPYQWLQFDKTNPDFLGKVLINRRYGNPANPKINKDFPYEEVMKAYPGQIIFIGTEIKDYDLFPYKDECEFRQIGDIDDWFTTINSAALYIGNLSGPSHIASALDKKRIIELPMNIDLCHWVGEEKYSDNLGWFIDAQHNYIKFDN
jgi:hypothetical protein